MAPNQFFHYHLIFQAKHLVVLWYRFNETDDPTPTEADHEFLSKLHMLYVVKESGLELGVI